jgi:ribosome-binding factor A
MSQRTDRVDELLREELGTLLAKELSDPRIGFATITDVETSPDLRHARVWVSVIGGKADRDETLRALQRSAGYLRHELGQRLRIRRIPELHMRLDDSAERGTRVLHLLNELEAGADPESITPLDESLPTPARRLRHEGDAEEPAEPGGAAGPDADPGAGSRDRARGRRGARDRTGSHRTGRGGSAKSGVHKPRRRT